jgi:hypothetical protein
MKDLNLAEALRYMFPGMLALFYLYLFDFQFAEKVAGRLGTISMLISCIVIGSAFFFIYRTVIYNPIIMFLQDVYREFLYLIKPKAEPPVSGEPASGSKKRPLIKTSEIYADVLEISGAKSYSIRTYIKHHQPHVGKKRWYLSMKMYLKYILKNYPELNLWESGIHFLFLGAIISMTFNILWLCENRHPNPQFWFVLGFAILFTLAGFVYNHRYETFICETMLTDFSAELNEEMDKIEALRRIEAI